jgi:hypothetical protein
MDQNNRLFLVLKVEAEGFFEVLDGVIARFTLTRHLDLEAAGDKQVAFLRDCSGELHAQSIRERCAVITPVPPQPPKENR